MPATKSDVVEDLFTAAYEVNEQQEQLNERRNGIRSSLRALKSAGVLSPEQTTEVDELYPVITRARKADGESENDEQ
jgi:hypothetical protein